MIRCGVVLSMALALGCATSGSTASKVRDQVRRDFSCSGAKVKLRETLVLESGAKAEVYDVSGCRFDATYVCQRGEGCDLVDTRDLRDGPCCEQAPDAAPGP
jgi:hypothetical protein